MVKDLSRRKFLEQVSVGTAAGMGYSLLGEWDEARAANQLAQGLQQPGDLEDRLGYSLGRLGLEGER